MKVAITLLLCLVIMANLPGMNSQPGCTKPLQMPNCESNKCSDLCLEKFGPNIYYFVCGCSASVKDTCLCKMPCK
ncbi:hypothetical protein ABFS83_02G068600 [Erythranthe nasuta]